MPNGYVRGAAMRVAGAMRHRDAIARAPRVVHILNVVAQEEPGRTIVRTLCDAFFLRDGLAGECRRFMTPAG